MYAVRWITSRRRGRRCQGLEQKRRGLRCRGSRFVCACRARSVVFASHSLLGLAWGVGVTCSGFRRNCLTICRPCVWQTALGRERLHLSRNSMSRLTAHCIWNSYRRYNYFRAQHTIRAPRFVVSRHTSHPQLCGRCVHTRPVFKFLPGHRARACGAPLVSLANPARRRHQHRPGWRPPQR